MEKFSQAVKEQIGYYVYILKDKTGDIFYVGKGKNDRIFEHINDALKGDHNSDKQDLIKKIGAKNVQHFILRHGLTEEQALEIESACIDLLGLDTLTNEVKGHDTWERGLKTVDEVVQHYDAKEIEITEPTIIININQKYERFMTPEELYEATRSSWKVGEENRNKAKYAIAAYRGLVREVYLIHEWKAKNDRWEFEGEVAEPKVREKYLNHKLDKYIKQGSQNPIKYVFPDED